MNTDNKRRDLIRVAVEDEGRLEYKELSELIGKNHSYVQQYVKRGVPRQLRDADWAIINAAISDDDAPSPSKSIANQGSELTHIPVFGFRAGMGGGGIALDESPESYLPLPNKYLSQIRLEAAELISFEMEGDSMSPTLLSGDRGLANTLDKNPARGGIFAIYDSDTIVVKRIEKIPNSDPVMLRLISDNPSHNSYDVIADDTNIIGRIVWFARRI